MEKILSGIHQFLRTNTPKSWLDYASQHIDFLLIDHAHCEKKAASSALRLIFRYNDRKDLLHKMSRLAREELKHFEMVLKELEQRTIEFVHLEPSRYASTMFQYIAHVEPEKLIDHLIVGAIIEARSCERFAALLPYLPDEKLQKFYSSLLASEGRHFQHYLALAQQYTEKDISPRVNFFLDIEATYITSPDTVFRFHSGVPIEGIATSGSTSTS